MSISYGKRKNYNFEFSKEVRFKKIFIKCIHIFALNIAYFKVYNFHPSRSLSKIKINNVTFI